MVILILYSPGASLLVRGVVPAKAPSISISAPSGLELISITATLASAPALLLATVSLSSLMALLVKD